MSEFWTEVLRWVVIVLIVAFNFWLLDVISRGTDR